MEPLDHPDNLHFEAVLGWLMLGDSTSARQDFARLSATARNRPEVLEVEWGFHAEAKDWPAAHAAARRLVEVAPDRPFGWIHQAYAVRRLDGGGLPAAWELLRPAYDRFPDEFLIAYNLGCYAAQMGRTDEAWQWLERASAGNRRETVRALALRDEDLRELWPRLQAETASPGTPTA